ncbi:MAG: hypothetical protein CHACPFDD_01323 [Phycisphaerae bacterium]|nr:hypothetical protein [Phycisphaerae bacterium]
MRQGEGALSPWILGAIHELNKSGSWTGRIHVQKHLFISQILGVARPPTEFVFYDWGPYSFDVDREMVDLELFGLVSRCYPKAGYGPKYELTALGVDRMGALDQSNRSAIERVAHKLGSRPSQDLELIATCLWVKIREQITDRDPIVKRVHELKPKYDSEQIMAQLRNADELEQTLPA